MHKAPIHWTAASSANARRAARPEIEFLCSHRLCAISSEFLRSCNMGPKTASNEPCWRCNSPVQFYNGLAAPIPSVAARGQEARQTTREWFTTSVANHSAHQADRAVMSSADWLHHIGRLEERR